MEADFLRQLNIFNPHNFGQRSVSVVGCGATGSYVALLLSQIGIQKVKVWDFDIVEDHNLPNQAFELEHVGKPKVECIKQLIKKKSGYDIEVHNEAVKDQDISATYIFLLTDTMESRKEIFKNCIRMKSLNTDLVIETRMDADNGRVYAFNPNNPAHVKEWEATLYKDEEASESLCGASVSLAPTVYFLASLAVWKLVSHFDVNHGPNNTKKTGKEQELDNEVIFQLGPETFMNRRFKTL